MARPDLYLPPGTAVETTTRTLCGMFLLPVTRYFAKIVRGAVVFPCWSFPPGLPFVRSGPVFEAFWEGCIEKLLPAEAQPATG